MPSLRLPSRRLWRSGVSRTERAIGLLILLLLVAIGVAVWVDGRTYDPDLFALNEALLVEATPGLTRVLPLAWDSPEWAPGAEVERYGPDDLYKKINGRADQYLSYDVKGMEFQSFALRADDSRFIDIYLYDMGTPLNAFGIFSAERTAGAPSVDLGQVGYDAGGSIFFQQGAFYAQVLPGEGDTESLAGGRALAEALSASLPAPAQEASAPDPAAMLPPEGLDRETIEYVREDALGLSFLRNAITASYEVGDDFVTLFLIQEDSPEVAEEVLGQYVAYIQKYGTIVEDGPTPAGRQIVGDVSGFFDVVFTQGAWVGGVSGATVREPIERLAARTRESLPVEGQPTK